MADTCSKVLARWDVPFEPHELFMHHEAFRVNPLLLDYGTACLHSLNKDKDFSSWRVAGMQFNLSELVKCQQDHAQVFMGPHAAKAERAVSLIFIAEYLKSVELSIQLGIDKFLSGRPYEYAAQMRLVKDSYSASFLADRFFTETNQDHVQAIRDLNVRAWNEVTGQLKSALKEKYGLPPLEKKEASAYFQITSMPSEFFEAFRRAYPCFKIKDERGYQNLIVELPVSVLNDKDLELKLESEGWLKFGKLLPQVGIIADSKRNLSLFVSHVYAKGTAANETIETFKVLVNEMSVPEAFKAARALAEGA